MKDYFLLQLRLTARRLSAFGINPVLGIILSGAIFVALSFLSFKHVSYWKYFYPLISPVLIIHLGNKRRNDFLKSIFERRYRFVRSLENILISIPFITFMIAKGFFTESIVCLVLSIAVAFVDPVVKYNFVFPTPFGKNPFEFLCGFRKTISFLIPGYSICLIGIITGNFNISAFSIIFLFFIFLSYYAEPEHEFYVWIHSKGAAGFLRNKIVTGIYHSTLLTFIPLLCAMIYFGEYFIPFVILFAGYMMLTVTILAKYSAWPEKINIMQFILLILSIQFPPLLIFVIPYFYNKSLSQLRPFLK